MRVDQKVETVEFHVNEDFDAPVIVVEQDDAEKALGHPLGEHGGLADDIGQLATMVFESHDSPPWFDPGMVHEIDHGAITWSQDADGARWVDSEDYEYISGML